MSRKALSLSRSPLQPCLAGHRQGLEQTGSRAPGRQLAGAAARSSRCPGTNRSFRVPNRRPLFEIGTREFAVAGEPRTFQGDASGYDAVAILTGARSNKKAPIRIR